jgi:hypothetical protein
MYQSADGTNPVTSQSYTIPAGNITLAANGTIPGILPFPTALLLPGTTYYFRLETTGFNSNSVSFTSTTTQYGTIEAQDNAEDGYFITACHLDDEAFSVTQTSVSIPCNVVDVTSPGENPNFKVAYGLFDEGATILGPSVLNTILNLDQTASYSVNLLNLQPNTDYVFKIVKATNPTIAYFTSLFTTGVGSNDTGGATNADNTGSTSGGMYGAADDTDFTGPGYENSLVKCNGTPTNPCRLVTLWK